MKIDQQGQIGPGRDLLQLVAGVVRRIGRHQLRAAGDIFRGRIARLDCIGRKTVGAENV